MGYNTEKNSRVNITANVKLYGKRLTRDNQGPKMELIDEKIVYIKISWNCPFNVYPDVGEASLTREIFSLDSGDCDLNLIFDSEPHR